MSNRKATFAKRQRESDLKDKARAKEARRVERRGAPNKDSKGPQIAWDEAVHQTDTPLSEVPGGDGSAPPPAADANNTTTPNTNTNTSSPTNTNTSSPTNNDT
jgi:hypothetical protein